MAIQNRRGYEADFDPAKMLPGEWAVSLDTKYVRMCFAPGECLRMATYEGFEQDMEEVRRILAECQTIEEAVSQIYQELQGVVVDVEKVEAAAQTATEKAEEAKLSAENASNYSIIAENKANEALQSANIASDSAIAAESSNQNAILKASEASEYSQSANTSAENAEIHAKTSKSYAVGGTGERLGEDNDNSKYYSGQAKKDADRAEAAAERAESITDIGIMTVEKAGIGKPDGTTITVDADGTMHSVGGGGGTTDYASLKNKPQIGGVELLGNKTLVDLGIQPAGDYAEKAELQKYALVENAGYSLSLTIDQSTYVMTLSLLNSAGAILDTKEIDFPIESMVVDADYNNGVITLTLQNGTTIPVDVSALVSGLVNDTFTIAGIDMKDNITVAELKTALGVDKIPNVATNDQTPTFSQETERTNIVSGEKLSVIFGKIMKFFADLKSVAFTGKYSDLSDTPSIPTKTSELENDSGYKTTDNDTWKANTADSEGYVEKGSGQANKVWKTDENGVPGWRTDENTIYSTMTGATDSAAGNGGLVPKPEAGEQDKYLRGDGTWQTPPGAITPINNLLATEPGSPLDAVQGKVLDDKITEVNRNLGNISNIGNDTYNSFEKLLQYYIDNGYLPDVNSIALIPVMTSNTTPSGVASASSINSTSEDAWCAFDRNDSSQWIASGTSDCWIQYKFDNASIVKKVSFVPSFNSSGIRIKNYKIQASNDGSAWDDLTDWLVCPNTEGQQTITLLNTTSYVYYRMSLSGTYGTNIGLKTLQLFGR